MKPSLILGAMLLAGLFSACGDRVEPRLERPAEVVSPDLAASTSEPTGVAQSQSVPTPTTAPEISPQEEEAIDIMWRLVGAYGSVDENAVRAAGRNGHPGLVPVLVEAATRVFEPELALEISLALEEITGDSVGGDFVLVGPWFSWMSRQGPPQVTLDGFDEWKGELLATIDPNFRNFIHKGVESRIPLWTVEWGGVVRDGIPPLEFPDVVPGNEVDFLNDPEPVFGVVINGEARAYPHRILGWHELANDRLGGELISFIF